MRGQSGNFIRPYRLSYVQPVCNYNNVIQNPTDSLYWNAF
jgi:hypothetical protein